MPLDTFICGSCHVTFNDIEQFIVHKRDSCTAGQGPDEGQGQAVTYTVEMECPTEDGTEAGGEFSAQGQDITTVVFPTGGEDQSQMVELSAPVEGQGADGSYNQTLLIVTTTTPNKTPGRKRGRSKKSEPPPKQPAKLPLPDKSADGKYHCSRCKKAFGKERHFITHRCMAASDYVDISKRDLVKIEGDEFGDEDDAALDMEVDDSEEYTVPPTVTNEDGELEERDELSSNILMSTDADAEQLAEKSTDQVQDIPIFKNPDEKIAFEESLNVDLSGLDVMFRVHMIEQDLNEKASQPLRHAGSNSFFLYSCKTCEKVFKTLSHMRLHCLIHTDLKPFKCGKCDYSCNSKGNLYTHMRKHTGQFYTCSKCEFKTVNKTHLIEHESTHSAEKHQCEMCKKDYKTLKSLINHIRKYHSSKKGKEYLERFMTGRQKRGMTIIHQCHVCNRKFKKKIDRDRHLFTHDIKDTPNVQHCELCDYSASRRVYLEKHFLKHRVVYQCCECPSRFLSSVRLIDHLTSQHGKDDPTNKWETLFEECINCSYFLPEPGLQPMNGQQDKGMINLPSELAVEEENAAAVSSLQDKITEAEQQAEGEKVRVETQSEVDAMVRSAAELGDTGDGVNNSDTAAVSDSNTDKPGENTAVTLEGESSSTEMEGVNNPTSDDIVSNKDDGENSEKKSEKLTKSDGEKEGDDGGEVDFITRLGYRRMNMTIFRKMRETFGEEECEYCGRLFYNKSDFEPHVRTHTGDKPFGCDKCGYRAITKDNLKRHVEREHEKVTYPCTECDYVSNSRTQMWSHQLKHRGLSPIECPICKETFETLKDLMVHGTASHPDVPEMDWQKSQGYFQKSQGKMGRRSYKCPYCEKVFFRASSELQKHLWIHQGIKPFKCPLCPYACRSKNNLQAHMLRHSSDKPFSCSECGKAYKSKTALLWHTRSHKGGKLFKCDKCPYEGNQKSHLTRHMETHNVMKRFACEHCDFSSNTVGYMKIHYSRHHRGKVFTSTQTAPATTAWNPNAQTSQTKVYRCMSCDYLFGNLSDMKRHLKDRHRVQVDNIYTMEPQTMGLQQGGVVGGEAHQVVPQQTDVQVVQMEDQETNLTTSEQDAGAALQALQTAATLAAPAEDLDEKTASAVNILQQIIDMSQQGAFGQQQITVQSEDGQMMAVNPETIIVQQGEEVVVSSAETGLELNQQYVIQYVTPQDLISREGGPQEPQTIVSQEVIQPSDIQGGNPHETQDIVMEGVAQDTVITLETHNMHSVASQEEVPLEPQPVESVALEIVTDQEVVATSM